MDWPVWATDFAIQGIPAPRGVEMPARFHVNDPCPVPDCRKPVTGIEGEPTLQTATVHGWVEIIQVAYTLKPCGHTFFKDVRPKPKPIKLAKRIVLPRRMDIILCNHPRPAEITSMGDSHNHILCCDCGTTWWSIKPLSPPRPVPDDYYDEDYD